MNQQIDPQTAQRLYEAGYLSEAPTFATAEQAAAAEPAKQMIDQKQIALNFKEDALRKREEQMRAFQVADADIESKLAPERQKLDEQKRGLVLTGEQKPEGTLTTDMPAQTGMPQVDPRDQIPSIPQMAGFDLQQEAIGLAGQAGAAKAAEIGAFQGQLQKDLQAQAQADEQMRLREQQELADKQAELSSEVDRVSALKIDPGRFWADKSTAQNIALGASLFLGAFGAARGGVNQAASVISNAIDKDIDMQQADIMQQTRGLDKKSGILSEMKSRFKDDRMAREAARVAYINDAQLKIQQMSSKYDSQIVKANAAKLIGELEVQKQTAQSQFMQQFQKLKPVTADADVNMLSEDQRERFVPNYGLALTKEDAKLAKVEVSENKSLNGSIDALLDIVNKGGLGKSMNRNLIAKAQLHGGFLLGKLRLPITGPGAMSDGERLLLKEIIADPTKIASLDSANRVKLETLKQKLNSDFNNKMELYGIPPEEKKLGFKPLK